MGCSCPDGDEKTDPPAERGTTHALVRGRQTLFVSSSRQGAEAAAKAYEERHPLSTAEIREIPPSAG